MAFGDIYRLKLTQVFALTGPESVNVFHYQQVTVAGSNLGSTDLLTAFQTQVINAIHAIQSAEVSTVQIAAENVVPGVDNAYANFTPGAEPGDISGDCLPPFVCWAYQLTRTSSAVKNGAKRFMGVPETDQDDGNPVLSNQAQRSALQSVLAGNIGVLGTTGTFQPVIYRVGRDAKTIPAKTIPALAPQAFSIAGAPFKGISSQVSRKFGRGS